MVATLYVFIYLTTGKQLKFLDNYSYLVFDDKDKFVEMYLY